MKNKKKKIIIIITAILCPLIILASAFFIYTGIYYHAKEYTNLENIECIKNKNYSIYSKKDSESDYLYIFYPGAKVESKAYIGLAETIANEGVDVAIVDMPFNLAFFGINRANKVIEENKNYTHYYIGGHSLGGSMATSYAHDNSDKIDGVILLGSYATKKMPDNLKCLSLMGSNDKIVKKDKVAKNREYFNESLYIDFVIGGGNHSNFGNYGHQKHDGEASISNITQWEISAMEIVELINL